MKNCIVLVLPLFLIISGCGKKENIGTAERPLVFAFTPAKNGAAVKNLSEKISQYLRQKSGLSIRTVLPNDYIPVIDGFEKSEIDAAFINTFGYLLAHYWGNADAHLCLVFRSGNSHYQGQLIGRTGEIQRPEDISGKKFAYADPYSTAGFILPLKYFMDKKIKPAETVFSGSYSKVVECVYSGACDAGAVYYDGPEKNGVPGDSRKELIARYPDVAKKVILISSTGSIQSGPVAIHRDIPAHTREKLIRALIEFAGSPEGKEALSEAYDAIGLVKTSDREYGAARKMLLTLNIDAESLIPGGERLMVKKNIERLRSVYSDIR